MRTRPPTGSHAQPVYDFDEWSRQHYGQTARKVQEMKKRKAFYAEQHQVIRESEWQGKIFGVVVLVMLVLLSIREYLVNDNPKSIRRPKN